MIIVNVLLQLQMTSRFAEMKPTMICTYMRQWKETRQAQLKLNYDRCITKTKSCHFFGNIYTPQGVMPDPKMVEDIKKMQAPQTKKELQSFSGIVNYLCHFIKDMSQLTHSMRLFLKKDIFSVDRKS